MNEMVERVAKAIAATDLDCSSWGNDILAELARAAIAAMREPNEAQYNALCATDKLWRDLNSYEVWTTYIDAVLKDA